jgi:hypothetical protein
LNGWNEKQWRDWHREVFDLSRWRAMREHVDQLFTDLKTLNPIQRTLLYNNFKGGPEGLASVLCDLWNALAHEPKEYDEMFRRLMKAGPPPNPETPFLYELWGELREHGAQRAAGARFLSALLDVLGLPGRPARSIESMFEKNGL